MNNNLHLFIGPKISDDMTISKLNSAKELSKHSITKDFSSIEDFNKFCGQFENEKELLTAAYRKDDDIHALCGEDLTEDLCAIAYDKDKNPIPIPYSSREKMSEEQKKELYKWYKERVKNATSNQKRRDDDNGLWRPSRK